jgi:hypothetical protein
MQLIILLNRENERRRNRKNANVLPGSPADRKQKEWILFHYGTK